MVLALNTCIGDHAGTVIHSERMLLVNLGSQVRLSPMAT